jgi:FKBP-type peptidyl-prolyl cis-trans isomerase
MQTKIAVILSVLFLFGISAGYVYLNQDRPIVGSTAVQSAKTANNTQNIGKLTPQQDKNISLGQTNKNQQTQSNTETILKPDQFTTYDSYQNSNQMYRQDLKAGTGAEAVQGKKVAVYYKGYLTDGTIFDQSRPDESGQLQPFVFTPGAGQVIAGWEQGIIGTKEGGTRRLVIPPIAGYGEAGQGAIPPNAVLVFDIELLEVEQ